MYQQYEPVFDQRISPPVSQGMVNNHMVMANQQPTDHQIKELCKEHLNRYVMGHLKNGTIIEGIIVDVDDESVTLLVVDKDASTDGSRQFGRMPGFFGFRPHRFPFGFFRFPFITPFIFPFFFI